MKVFMTFGTGTLLRCKTFVNTITGEPPPITPSVVVNKISQTNMKVDHPLFAKE